MLRLVRYELKKLAARRAVLLALLLFTLIDFAKIAGVYRENSYLYDTGAEIASWAEVHRQLYDDYRGEITPEKIKALLALYHPLEARVAERTATTRTDDPSTRTGSLYGDYFLLRRYFVLPMQEFYSYAETARQAAGAARENAAFYAAQGNAYESRKNALLYRQFAGRSVDSFAYREMANYYLHYDFSSALVLLLGLYGLAGVFVREKESAMESVLLVSPRGGGATALAKLAAAGLFLAGVSLWFSLVDFAGFALAFGTLEGLSLPVYALSNFAASPLRATVGGYAVLSALARALGVWALGMLLLLPARFGKNALPPFLTGLLLCLGLVAAGTSSAAGPVWAKVCNPFSLVQSRLLFSRSEFVNVGGWPVPAFLAALACAALAGGVCAALVWGLADKNKLRRARRAAL